MSKLKFNAHQYCIFHFKLTIKRLVRNHINEIKQEKIIEIKQNYTDPSDDFIKEEVKKCIKKEKKEIRYSLELLYYLFQEKSHEYAESYIHLLRTNSVNFPPFLKEYLDEEFFPYYYKFIHYIKNLISIN